MTRLMLRALWLARLVAVAVGLLVVVALVRRLHQGAALAPARLVADEPPPGAEFLGAEFLGAHAGPEPPDGRRAAAEDDDDDGLVDGAEDADDRREEEQKVAFSLSRIASLLGWGARSYDDTDSLEAADQDRIRLSDLKPLQEAKTDTPRVSSDWADSPLLKAFVARFGLPRVASDVARQAADLNDGELQDFVATSPSSRPDARTPTTAPDDPQAGARARSAQPEVAPTPPTPPLPELPACPLNGVITTQAAEGAGTGTRVFEYAAAWLVSRAVGVGWRTPLVPAVVLRDLSPLLESPSLAAVERLPAACRLDAGLLRNGTDALAEDDLRDVQALPTRFLDPREPLVVHSGVLLPHLMAAHLHALRLELALKGELVLAARALLEVCRQGDGRGDGLDDGLGDGLSDATPVRFVAVHVRRHDPPAPWLRGRRRRPPGADYFRVAMEYFRAGEQAAAVVFAVTTDDPEWVRDNLGTDGAEVCVIGSQATEHPVDLAVLAACDGAILDLGDAALAAAVLAAKQVVAPRALRAAAPGLTALPGWTFL